MQPRRNRNLQSSLFLCEKPPKTPYLEPPEIIQGRETPAMSAFLIKKLVYYNRAG